MRDPLLSLVRLMASKNPTDLAKTLSEQGKVNIPKNLETFTSFDNNSDDFGSKKMKVDMQTR